MSPPEGGRHNYRKKVNKDARLLGSQQMVANGIQHDMTYMNQENDTFKYN